INNDDSSTIYIGDSTVTEGQTLAFVVSLTTTSASNVTFQWRTWDGTATTAGSDYTGVGLTNATIAAGQLNITLSVVTTQDANVEMNETLTVSLSSVVNASVGDDIGLGTINNDDQPGLYVADSTVTEGGTLAFVVSITAATPSNVTFQWRT